MHPEPHTDLNNLSSMQHNLRTSANKGSNDAYDVHTFLTGYEPNEFGNSQGSFSYITPSSDQDIDDTTLGKLLTEAHREYADYRSLEGVSVSQSSLSVVFDRTGKPVERNDIDHSGFSVRNVYSAQNQFPVITQAERMVDRTRKLMEEMFEIAEERESSSAQIRTLFDEKQKRLSQSVARKFLITNSKQLEQNKNAKFYKENYCDNNRIFVKFINKILQ